MSWTESNSTAVTVLSLNLANHSLLPGTPRDLPSPPTLVPEYKTKSKIWVPWVSSQNSNNSKNSKKTKICNDDIHIMAFNYKIEITKHWGRGIGGIKRWTKSYIRAVGI